MSELRTRIIRDMTLRGFSPSTHEAYIGQVVQLAKYYKRSPDQLTDGEVQAYLANLIQERRLSWSTCSQAAHAFRFLYHVTLGHPRTDFPVIRTPILLAYFAPVARFMPHEEFPWRLPRLLESVERTRRHHDLPELERRHHVMLLPHAAQALRSRYPRAPAACSNRRSPKRRSRNAWA
jgi:Phage integrase, N-terminal SAM-like domain